MGLDKAHVISPYYVLIKETLSLSRLGVAAISFASYPTGIYAKRGKANWEDIPIVKMLASCLSR